MFKKAFAFLCGLAVTVYGSGLALALETDVESKITTSVTSVVGDINTILGIIVAITLAVVAARWVIRMIKAG
jgi:hypothetical protein